MNTDKNARYQETESDIMEAYGRLARTMPIEKITVSAICREAGIHRTTFYGHYQDIIELGDSVTVMQLNKFIDAFVRRKGYSFDKGIRAQLQFYYDNRAAVKRHMLSVSRDSESLDIKHLLLPGDINKQYAKCFGCLTEAELKYHQIFFENGFYNVIKNWIMGDCVESAEEVADIILRIYKRAMSQEYR